MREEVSMVPYSPNTSETISDLDYISLAQKLQLAIDASMRKPEDIQVQQSLSNILKYELTIGEQTGKRGYHLEKVYQMLLTIPAPQSKRNEHVLVRHIYATNLEQDSVIALWIHWHS